MRQTFGGARKDLAHRGTVAVDDENTSHGAPSAGWYKDPRVPGQARYWDGAAWTARVRRYSKAVQVSAHASANGLQQTESSEPVTTEVNLDAPGRIRLVTPTQALSYPQPVGPMLFPPSLRAALVVSNAVFVALMAVWESYSELGLTGDIVLLAALLTLAFLLASLGPEFGKRFTVTNVVIDASGVRMSQHLRQEPFFGTLHVHWKDIRVIGEPPAHDGMLRVDTWVRYNRIIAVNLDSETMGKVLGAIDELRHAQHSGVT